MPAANVLPSGESATLRTIPDGLGNACSSLPESTCQTLTCAPATAASFFPSEEKTRRVTELGMEASLELAVFCWHPMIPARNHKASKTAARRQRNPSRLIIIIPHERATRLGSLKHF